MKARLFFSAASFALALVACGRPFDVKTAPGFLEVKTPSSYDYRAATPDGVVVGIRVIPVEGEGSDDLAFWTHAFTIQLRDVNGYALLESHDVQSLDGAKGKQLRFGHDDNGVQKIFWVTFFAEPKRLFIVEAGGEKVHFGEALSSVQWMIQSVKVR